MLRARVPEAAVYENGYSLARKNYVRLTADDWERTPMYPVSQAEAVQCGTQCALRRSVALGLSSHPPRYTWG